MNSLLATLIVTLLGGGGGGGVIAYVMNRKRIGAEAGNLDAQATEIIERTAGQSVERLSKQNAILEAKVDDLERKVERLQIREMQMRDLLMVHGGWDHRMQAELEQRLSAEEIETLGLFPAPPLYPPS